jgi:hypothetical protein
VKTQILRIEVYLLTGANLDMYYGKNNRPEFILTGLSMLMRRVRPFYTSMYVIYMIAALLDFFLV